jgi:quercetin dioxygenase-like cupin family protein
MAPQIRRVVTGHDTEGKAVVVSDGVMETWRSPRPGSAGCVFWTTDRTPADNSTQQDRALADPKTCHPFGSVLRIIEYRPGCAPRVHRTATLDYAIVMAGEIDMELDEGSVHLKSGDVLIQRGTIHNWVNNGTSPCIIAFVLIGAHPVEIAGRQILADG